MDCLSAAMSHRCIIELATRHGLSADELTAAWSERAAIRQHLAGFSQPAAELWAVGDVEQMYQIGLHCPQTRRSMLAGGVRKRPTKGTP
jgi:hypothetical protein